MQRVTSYDYKKIRAINRGRVNNSFVQALGPGSCPREPGSELPTAPKSLQSPYRSPLVLVLFFLKECAQDPIIHLH